jgi:hypothetical protein
MVPEKTKRSGQQGNFLLNSGTLRLAS